MRYALGIEYNGTGFSGWQFQHAERTAQETLEQALSKVAAHPVKTICAGRTDAGVHASGQVVHFDSDAPRSLRAWVLGANSNLPRDLSVLWAEAVPEDFHARFSAEARSYRYVILNRWVRPAIQSGQVTWHHHPLDAVRMHTAGQYLLGEHDFSAFRAQACQAHSPIRRMERIAVTRHGDYVVLEVTANAFLHHMVRNIAGTLMRIGSGEYPEAWIAEVLAGRDCKQAGVTAPPDGLCLMAVRYPGHYRLPAAPPPAVFF